MVFCIIAVVISGILGIFSAKYRTYAKEAFRCLVTTIQLRPCEMGFDDKMRAKAAAKLSRIHPRLASFVYKQFRLISWILVMLFIASFSVFGVSVYNYWAYGNCNGPDSSEFCIFAVDPAVSDTEASCSDPSAPKFVTPVGPGTGNPTIGSPATITVVELGCYTCTYTKAAQPLVDELLRRYEGKIQFVFRVFPLPNHAQSDRAAQASYCAWEQPEHFWEIHQQLLSTTENLTNEVLLNIAQRVGIDGDAFLTCINESRYTAKIEENYNDGVLAGIYGTPTFFVRDQVIVGPKTIEPLVQAIEKEL